eukprot:TRINITY_DN10795_c0_g1_i2.p1 TRINITY_DN10795_c0_g1~~TRINITY_DN10795_c0_g1_i2.p1  ORF type:complete len:148 (+),score=33.16 TRINITY_DN10795_c0_g1_i2:52-495(+)
MDLLNAIEEKSKDEDVGSRSHRTHAGTISSTTGISISNTTSISNSNNSSSIDNGSNSITAGPSPISSSARRQAPLQWSAAKSSQQQSAIRAKAAGSSSKSERPAAQKGKAEVSIPFYLEHAELCPKRRSGDAQFVISEPPNMILFTQ